jgi:hypothetical protein
MLVYFMVTWSILWQFDIIYGHAVYFVEIGTFSSVLVNCTKKNLATLKMSQTKFVALPFRLWLLSHGGCRDKQILPFVLCQESIKINAGYSGTPT